MNDMLSTREVAKFLNINEKMVYSLIAEKGLPASKVTGKWLFPRELVYQWIEAGTQNFPQLAKLPPYHGLVLIAGSNDLLLDKIIATFNLKHDNHMAMFGITGSMGGLKALKQNRCHMASSHLVADNEEYNFPFLKDEMNQMPAVVNFSLREQGIIIQKGNPKNITSVKDLGKPGIKIINRQLGTGTRQLFDKELKKSGIKGKIINGYENLKGKVIQTSAQELGGYDLSMTGKMIYPEA